ncbi:MAG: hypothetical protein KKC05_01680 [Nanoarchaeota archaeon]|nr:hypothetical protein [Nanoarchaeota archaeon]
MNLSLVLVLLAIAILVYVLWAFVPRRKNTQPEPQPKPRVSLKIKLIQGPVKFNRAFYSSVDGNYVHTSQRSESILLLTEGDVVVFCRERSNDYDPPNTTHWIMMNNPAISRAHLTLRVYSDKTTIADEKHAINKALLDGVIIPDLEKTGSYVVLSPDSVHRLQFKCVKEKETTKGCDYVDAQPIILELTVSPVRETANQSSGRGQLIVE